MSIHEILGRSISASMSLAIVCYLLNTYSVELTVFQYLVVYQLFFISNILMFSDFTNRGKK